MFYTFFVGQVEGGKIIVYGNGMAIQLKSQISDNLRKKLTANLRLANRSRKENGIREFSAASKRRLKRLLSSFDFEALERAGYSCYFCTGTYQKDLYFEFMSPDDVKKHLKLLKDRFSYRFPDGFYLWKVEYHRSGAVHVHFLFFVVGVSYTDFLAWFEKTWIDSFKSVIRGRVAFDDERLLRMYLASTNVRYVPLRLANIISIYINKEVGKGFRVSSVSWQGRFWGLVGRKNAQRYRLIRAFEIDPSVFFKLRRVMIAWASLKGLKYSVHQFCAYAGLTLFSTHDFYFDLFRYLDYLLLHSDLDVDF